MIEPGLWGWSTGPLALHFWGWEDSRDINGAHAGSATLVHAESFPLIALKHEERCVIASGESPAKLAVASYSGVVVSCHDLAPAVSILRSACCLALGRPVQKAIDAACVGRVVRCSSPVSSVEAPPVVCASVEMDSLVPKISI